MQTTERCNCEIKERTKVPCQTVESINGGNVRDKRDVRGVFVLVLVVGVVEGDEVRVRVFHQVRETSGSSTKLVTKLPTGRGPNEHPWIPRRVTGLEAGAHNEGEVREMYLSLLVWNVGWDGT